MRKVYTLLLVLFSLAGVQKSHAQEEQAGSPHNLAAKVLFLDYATPNGLDLDTLPISNGMEVGYIRNFNKYLNIAFPVKVALANVEGFVNRRTVVCLDAVLQGQYQKTPNSFLTPYVFGGGSIVFENFEMTSLQFPVGLGLNLRLAPNTFLNLQGEYRYSLAENRTNLTYGAGLVFRLVPSTKEKTEEEVPPPPPPVNKKDKDADGVLDDKDECPDEPGIASLLGCPDRDGDTVADKIDQCPDEPGPASSLGCPVIIEEPEPEPEPEPAKPLVVDSDGDGLDDTVDKCPNEYGPANRGGCPAKDTDGDGILDDKDECPDQAGTLPMMGCPDTDNDGISDQKDKCPTEAGPAETNGCPKKDSDRDGILDADDECPQLAGPKALKGCPDTDSDGIPDKDDNCPSLKGTKEWGGCPDLDADDDGVNDDVDQCPKEPGSKAAKGCPDKDGDGVPDKTDNCPDRAGPYNGCPDTDDDGVEDSKDNCPDIAGPISNLGCPEVKKEDREYLDFATQAVNFQTGKALLESESFGVLDQVAEILQKYPYYKCRIIGHTDNTGAVYANQVLSEERAKSCYEYLLSRGLTSDRISFVGKGASAPIATNATEEGRELNRRVEFELYAK
ncbi:MAG: OmpA family protein [Saprospirales bacterium]|nr:OmpA family protein [Saprospirales bacterium]